MVAGTIVSVQRIAGCYSSVCPEEIAENFGHLSLAHVHAALAHYHSNRDEIEGTSAMRTLPTRKGAAVGLGRVELSVAFALYFDEDSVNRALIRTPAVLNLQFVNEREGARREASTGPRPKCHQDLTVRAAGRHAAAKC